MKILIWLLRSIVFIALLGLAIKNDHAVELYFYFGKTWQMPLSIIVLIAFTAGVTCSLMATFSRLAHQWREIGRLRKRG